MKQASCPTCGKPYEYRETKDLETWSKTCSCPPTHAITSIANHDIAASTVIELSVSTASAKLK